MSPEDNRSGIDTFLSKLFFDTLKNGGVTTATLKSFIGGYVARIKGTDARKNEISNSISRSILSEKMTFKTLIKACQVINACKISIKLDIHFANGKSISSTMDLPIDSSHSEDQNEKEQE